MHQQLTQAFHHADAFLMTDKLPLPELQIFAVQSSARMQDNTKLFLKDRNYIQLKSKGWEGKAQRL